MQEEYYEIHNELVRIDDEKYQCEKMLRQIEEREEEAESSRMETEKTWSEFASRWWNDPDLDALINQNMENFQVVSMGDADLLEQETHCIRKHMQALNEREEECYDKRKKLEKEGKN